MNRTLSDLGPALFLSAVMLVATTLVGAAPHASWTAAAGPLLLGLALVGIDIVQRRRSGRGSLPAPGVLLLAAALLAACGIVASGDPGRLAGMFPILGSSVVAPVLLRREGARPACRRA
ncbi:MAG: hypothetical protein M3O15_01865 [Acidobacteriota bacterium]|nr:hypothetical protein [Acidobacteriota bacterium]